MSLANRLTGMTDEELAEYEFRPVRTKDDVSHIGPCPRDVRMAMGLIITSEDLKEERERLLKPLRGLLRR